MALAVIVVAMAALATNGGFMRGSASHVAPVFTPGNPSCPAGTTEFKIEDVEDGVFTDGTLTITLDAQGSAESGIFSFTSNIGVDAVIAKGGDNANVYFYNPETTGDDNLSTPINPANDKPFGTSHISFCYDADAPTNTPTVVVPTDTPTVVVPTDTPTEVVPTDTPTEVVPTDTPTVVVPTDTPTVVVPTDTPTVIVPTDTPTTPAETPTTPAETPTTPAETPTTPAETPTNTATTTVVTEVPSETATVGGATTVPSPTASVEETVAGVSNVPDSGIGTAFGGSGGGLASILIMLALAMAAGLFGWKLRPADIRR